jgi:hypothetical protein
MVIDNLYIEAVAIAPHKTDSPLVIDSNRVLPFAITPQCLQLVAWR